MRLSRSNLEKMKKIYPKEEYPKFEKHIIDNNIRCKICGRLITVEEWLDQYFEHDTLKEYTCDKCDKEIKGMIVEVSKGRELKITKKQFQEYVIIQKSGVTNMCDVKLVQSLSGLAKLEIMAIQVNYGALKKEFKDEEFERALAQITEDCVTHLKK